MVTFALRGSPSRKDSPRHDFGGGVGQTNHPEIKKAAQNKLRELLDARGSQFGSTPTGREWCIKALHPSDDSVDCKGIPDLCASPATVINYRHVVKIGALSTLEGAGTWDADVTIIPTPTVIGRCFRNQQGNTHITNWTNQTYPGTIDEVNAAFRGLVTRWRLCYFGVSVYLDAPALANQGTVLAAQYEVAARDLGPATLTTEGGLLNVPDHMVSSFPEGWNPDAVTLEQMPNSYFGQAKDGCYLPLKLDDNRSRWFSDSDCRYDATRWLSNPDGQAGVLAATAASSGYGPYPSATQLFRSGVNQWVGTLLQPFGNKSVGRIVLQNLSKDATISVYYRFGIEATVRPNSSLAPYMHLSPLYDPAALTEYHMVARELKDAYPVAYNDFGKLWDTLKSVASFIAPVLPAFGPVGSVIKGVGETVGRGIDALMQKTNPRDTPAASYTERSVKAIEAPRAKRLVTKAKKKRATGKRT